MLVSWCISQSTAGLVQKGFLVVSEYNGEPQILKLKCKPNNGLFSLIKFYKMENWKVRACCMFFWSAFLRIGCGTLAFVETLETQGTPSEEEKKISNGSIIYICIYLFIIIILNGVQHDSSPFPWWVKLLLVPYGAPVNPLPTWAAQNLLQLYLRSSWEEKCCSPVTDGKLREARVLKETCGGEEPSCSKQRWI